MRKPVGRIPKFISSESPKGLQRKMLQVQSRLGYGVEWFDIQHDKKQWIAWYIDQDDITLLNVEEKLDTTTG
jgi:hypothetical protein